MRQFLTLAAVWLLVLGLATPCPEVAAEFAAGDQLDGPLGQMFVAASQESGVPVELLVALGYAQTRLDDHNGRPSVAGGYGVMHLVDTPDNPSLRTAAQLLGTKPEKLRTDTALNIRGAAQLLAHYGRETSRGRLPATLAGWYPAVAAYFQARSELVARLGADAVYAHLQQGIDVTVDGESLHLEPRAVRPDRGRYAGVLPDEPAAPGATPGAIRTPDYFPAHWIPAHSSNYDAANRPTDHPIRYVVIHVTQGSYASAINWFQNPNSNVSAHYVIRSSDGDITQMVREKDIGWHAGNRTYNEQSIGIEHEGYVSNCTWFTDIMYRTSAYLVRHITARYGIPRDREHIIGHNEVPGATHTDPGPCWDWTYYMSLVNGNWSQVVDNAHNQSFRASSNWDYSSWNSQKYGSDYRFARPCACADGAWYTFDIPAWGYYDIYVWYPSHAAYNPRVPIGVLQSNANCDGWVQVVRYVDQTRNGGRWVWIGTFPLLGGRHEIVAVSRWTDETGYIMADAVAVVLH